MLKRNTEVMVTTNHGRFLGKVVRVNEKSVRVSMTCDKQWDGPPEILRKHFLVKPITECYDFGPPPQLAHSMSLFKAIVQGCNSEADWKEQSELPNELQVPDNPVSEAYDAFRCIDDFREFEEDFEKFVDTFAEETNIRNGGE